MTAAKSVSLKRYEAYLVLKCQAPPIREGGISRLLVSRKRSPFYAAA